MGKELDPRSIKPLPIPEGLDCEKIVAIHKMGGYWSWRHFRRLPERLMVFTNKGIFEIGYRKGLK